MSGGGNAGDGGAGRASGGRDAVWPRGAPAVGARAERTRRVEAADIERFTAMTGDRNPLHCLRTTVTREDGVVALEGTALCYTTPL